MLQKLTFVLTFTALYMYYVTAVMPPLHPQLITLYFIPESDQVPMIYFLNQLQVM